MAKKDYTNWDKKDLIKEIEQPHKRKKHGLVWEDKPENVVGRLGSGLAFIIFLASL